jgi:acetyl esterase/lipase
MLAPSSLLGQTRLYLGEQDPRKVPLASPLYAELHGLPPLLIHVGQDEILRDDSTQVTEKIKASGGEVTLKVWEGMWHVFQMQSATVPEAQQAVNEIGRFLHERLNCAEDFAQI